MKTHVQSVKTHIFTQQIDKMSNLATNPVDLTNEEETQEWLNNIEVEYSYACYKEKDADFCFRWA